MFHSKPPRNPEVRWVWIMAMLRARKTSFAEIGRELNIGRFKVCHVKTRRCPEIEEAISVKLGLTPADIWPERYPVVPDNKQNGGFTQ